MLSFLVDIDRELQVLPTVLIADAQGTRFFGPLPPQPQNLSRLLDSLSRSSLSAKPHDAVTLHLMGALQAAPEFWIRG